MYQKLYIKSILHKRIHDPHAAYHLAFVHILRVQQLAACNLCGSDDKRIVERQRSGLM